MKVVANDSIRSKKAKKRKVVFLTPGGISSMGFNNAEEDAKTLIEAEAIRNDPIRYKAAKKLTRGA